MMRLPIENYAYRCRDLTVVLDFDVALLFDLSTKRLNQIVKRHRNRFPESLVFRLDAEEFASLLTFTDRPAAKLRNLRYRPYAFTPEGIQMLSNILKTPLALRISLRLILYGKR
jgi:hypothetical protein